MVKNIFSKVNTKISVSKAAILLAGSYFASSLLGLFRERLLAARFGLGTTLDAYFSAFSLIDLVYYLLVSGALSVVIVPILSSYMDEKKKKEMWEFVSSSLNFLSLSTFLLAVVFFFFPEQIISLVFRGFEPGGERFDIAVKTMRILALNPLLFSISSVFASVQQAFGRFFFFALAPVTYNVGIIIGILYLAPSIGIEGVAYGAVLGAVMQMLIQSLGLLGLGYRYKPSMKWRTPGFKKFIRLLIPRSLDQGVDQLNSVVERAIASFLATGAIASYQYAYTLKSVPITLIGVAIATAAFPSISRRAASTRTDLFRKEIAEIARAILWLALPAAAITIILRGYLVRLLIGSGDPTVASILGWFAVAIVFQALLQLATRTFYARKNTKMPLYISVVAIIINIAAAYGFVKVFGIKGLAMAQSLVAVIEVSALGFILRKEIGSYISREWVDSMLRIVVATTLMAGVTYSLVVYVFPLFASDVGFFTLAPKFGAIVATSFLSYLTFSYLFGLSEAQSVVSYVKKIVFKRVEVEE